MSASLPEKVKAGLEALERGFSTRRRVPLVVTRSEAMLPWEADVRKTLLATRTTSELWLYRPVPTTRARESRSSTVGLTLLHDARDRWLQALWSASPNKPSEHAAIVHAIGIPIRMSSGMRLQIGRDDQEGRRVGDLFSGPRLLVLQLPVVDSLVRGATDRQQVADLRELAFETALSGTLFVLVLPALTKEDAVLLTTALAKQLGEEQPSLDLLLAITENLRSLLLRPGDPHEKELAELAFDITLFVADTGPLQGGKTTK